MNFTYTAFDRSGSPANGSTEARDAAEGSELLRRQGLFVLKIQPVEEEQTAIAINGAMRFGKARKLKNLAMFTRQLHVLISTGTPLVEALRALERQAKDPQWHAVIAAVRTRVEEGASLSAAMSHYPHQFNAICRGLISAGESGGNMDLMLDRLALLAKKQLHVRGAIMGALIYPCLLIVVSFGVLITLLTFVLPRFTVLFKTLDTPLPPTTQILMNLSDLTRAYWWIAIIAVGSVGFAVWTWIQTEAGKRMMATAMLSAPRIGPITRNFATAQITRLLGILLQGRVPLIEALQLTRESTTNHHYDELLKRASDAVTRGDSLASAFSDSKLVTASVYEAMRSGDKSGQLGPLLNTIADFLDEENEVTLRSLTSILEPVILVGLGVVVGFVALSLFLPLFDLTAATRGGN